MPQVSLYTRSPKKNYPIFKIFSPIKKLIKKLLLTWLYMHCSKISLLRTGVVGWMFVCAASTTVFGQDKPAARPEKPLKVEDRRPPSEKMAAKPFTVTRRVVQNTVTRYNYYYHAKLKLEKVLTGINRQRQDNYNVFLPFYPFTVDKLNLDVNELDSVVQKASVAVQIHDPRGRWIDDCYLLVGKAYYYKGDWENAFNTFQYINTTFAPKKKSEYNTVVGRSQDDLLSISSREKEKTWYAREFRHKSSRNDAFLWQARTLIEQKKHDEAQSLLNILESDPYFPRRLDGQLAELQAWKFYKQGMYAETIEPLKIAIKKGNSGRDQKARMYYILGQLYAYQSKPDSAMTAFREVISLKPDATIDFNARVQIAKANTRINGGSLEESIKALESMLRKERFISFRDAIYYNMAVLCANDDPERAIGYLEKALRVESANMLQKTLTFKGMADIYYFRKSYRDAQRYYDSTAAIMGPDFHDAALVNARKESLGAVAEKVQIIRDEDSLQQIAALSPAMRDSFLVKQVAAIKAAKTPPPAEGGKKGSSTSAQAPSGFNTNNNFNNPSFGPGNEGGEWYFYNQNNKSAGFSEFRRRWGNRALGDNWRRSQQSGALLAGNNNNTAPEGQTENTGNTAASIADLPADSINTGLLAGQLPDTPEKLEASRDRQENAYYDLGKLYNDKLDDTREGISTYDTLLNRFPDHPRKVEVLYSLYAWHNKLNHNDLASKYKQQILTQHAGTQYASILTHGLQNTEDKAKTQAAASIYEAAYESFRKGNYDTIFVLRKLSDSIVGYSSLQPKFDLLEAMAIIKTGTEDEGKAAIGSVITKYPGDAAILTQAKSIQEALERRQELTEYLTKLEITRDSSGVTHVDENIRIRYPWQTPQPNMADSLALKAKLDSAAAAANVPPPPPAKPVTPYQLGAEKASIPHFVVVHFDRVSKVLIDEAVAQFTKYNTDKYPASQLQTSTYALTPTEIMVIVRLFPDENKALDYFDEISRVASETIIPRIRPTDYRLFIISRENFILLNNTKDIEGYRTFFNNNYITE